MAKIYRGQKTYFTRAMVFTRVEQAQARFEALLEHPAPSCYFKQEFFRRLETLRYWRKMKTRYRCGTLSDITDFLTQGDNQDIL